MTKVKLSEVIRRCQTRADRYDTNLLYYVAGEHFESGEIDLAGRGEIAGSTIGPMFYYGFKPGDFLLVSRNPHLRKASRVDFAGVCSEKTFVLETANESVLSTEYLPWVLQNDRFWNYAQENRHGSTNFFINWSTLADYVFELPSIEDQKRIATILWAAQSVRRNYRKLLKACDDVVKSQFVEMFSDVGHTNPLEKLIIPNTRISYGIVQPGPGGTGDMGVLRPVDIVDGYLCLDEVKRIDEKIGYPYRRTELKGTEVLTVVRGATGQTVRSNASCIGMNVTRGIAVIRYDSRLIDPDYLVGYMNSNEGQHYIADHTKGATLQQINISDLKVMPIPVPSIRRQQQFAAFVTQVDKSKFKLGICGGML